MDHKHVHKQTVSTVTSSISSIILSIIASSHHWLHIAILFLLGGSTNIMVNLTGIMWVRRILITVTVITSLFSLYRFIKHKHMPFWLKLLTGVSILISFSFIGYTFVTFGW